MATLLDVGALSFFLPVFVFIFIFAILLALLEKTKLLGEGQRVLNIAAAFSVAAIAVLAGRLTGLVSTIVPWVVFIFVLLILVFALFGFFGMKDKEIWDLFGQETVFIIVLIIIVVSITTVYEGTVSPYTPGVNGAVNPRTETLRTLTHPRLLGALFTLVVASATVTYLTKRLEGGK